MSDPVSTLKYYLEFLGYDGMFNTPKKCQCTLDNLEPCGLMEMSCSAGYKRGNEIVLEKVDVDKG